MTKPKMTTELVVTLVLLVSAALSVAFMGQLVAPPKVMMGRMLTAISPSLFPTLILSALAVLSALLALLILRTQDGAVAPEADDKPDRTALRRGVLLFLCMTLYAVTMVPFGFLISSFIALVLVSLLAGNRSVPQILALATVGPVCLYLAATRILAVSLPELNAVELFYAQQLGL